MRLSKIISLLVALLFTHSVNAQLILWSRERPLIWDDFKGKKPQHKRKRSIATTNSMVWHKMSKEGDSIVVNVAAMFNTEKSWKKNVRLSTYVLKHEQIHFDIAELYARKLRKSIAEYTLRYGYDAFAAHELHKMFEHNRAQRRRCQRRYDRQTNHSRRREEQEKWNADIARKLNELNTYAK